jgi:hypothetical protein
VALRTAVEAAAATRLVAATAATAAATTALLETATAATAAATATVAALVKASLLGRLAVTAPCGLVVETLPNRRRMPSTPRLTTPTRRHGRREEIALRYQKVPLN